jgi:hypothetical protein
VPKMVWGGSARYMKSECAFNFSRINMTHVILAFVGSAFVRERHAIETIPDEHMGRMQMGRLARAVL